MVTILRKVFGRGAVYDWTHLDLKKPSFGPTGFGLTLLS